MEHFSIFGQVGRDDSWLDEVIFIPAWWALMMLMTRGCCWFHSEITDSTDFVGFFVSSTFLKRRRLFCGMVYVRASCCELARLSRESLNWFSIDACFQRLSGTPIDSFSSYKNPLFSFYWFLSFSKTSTRINNSRWKSYWNLGYITWWRLSLPPTRPPVFWFFQTPWPFILIVSGIEACCRLIVCSSSKLPITLPSYFNQQTRCSVHWFIGILEMLISLASNEISISIFVPWRMTVKDIRSRRKSQASLIKGSIKCKDVWNQWRQGFNESIYMTLYNCV